MSDTAPHPVRLATRMREIAPFHVMELLQKAQALEAAGRSVVTLCVGEPDFPTPQPMLDAALAFIRRGDVHYTSALGLPALREAISGYYAERFGIDVAPSRIAITTGASAALQLALGILVEPGDEWLVPDPGYPCNRHFVRLFGGQPLALDVDETSDFQPTPQLVRQAWSERTRGLMVASPSNPTGTVLDAQSLAALCATVESLGGNILVDEIYQGLNYGSPAHTVLSAAADAFVINSFSKYFGMTGWRLGWLVAPEGCVRDIEKLAQNLFICPPTPAQHAALAAFAPGTRELLEERRAEFERRRDFLRPALESLGFRIAGDPRGAFYLYADVSRLCEDSERFAHDLLERCGVALTPGLDFGQRHCSRYVRIAYTRSVTALETAAERIAAALTASR